MYSNDRFMVICEQIMIDIGTSSERDRYELYVFVKISERVRHVFCIDVTFEMRTVHFTQICLFN